jgi:hypothetical protein
MFGLRSRIARIALIATACVFGLSAAPTAMAQSVSEQSEPGTEVVQPTEVVAPGEAFDPVPVTEPGAVDPEAVEAADEAVQTTESVETCSYPSIVRPFLQFEDTREYVLAPGADFEEKYGHGWELSGAKVAGGNARYRVGGTEDHQSLRMGTDGSTMSPTMCVDLNYPTFRFFARAFDASTSLKVEVAYPDSADPSFEQVALLVGTDYDGVWALTEDVTLSPERGGTAFGGRGAVMRFTVIGESPDKAGAWRIDDIYIDPRYY